MKILTNEEIKNLSFPDYSVELMKINTAEKIVEIKTNGGYLSVSGHSKLTNCLLTIKNWISFNALLYHATSKEWEELRLDNIDLLTDICEFEFGAEIIFRGFGKKTGQWLQLTFKHAEIEIKCD